ncbi:hypothetical protein NL676_018927 [Syzygium grande]|nr:hypothetical protein NL676_018927 [Syzygium grande]
MSAKSELASIPCPGFGHLASMVEMAKLLFDSDDQLSITILIMKFPFDSEIDTPVELLIASAAAHIRFVLLPQRNPPPKTSPLAFLHYFMESLKSNLQEAVPKISACGTPWFAGLIVDASCTLMINVAIELSVPSYMFFTSSAACVKIMLHLQSLQDKKHMDLARFKGPNAKLDISCFAIPLRTTRTSRIGGLGAPAVYHVGLILNIKVESKTGFETQEWPDQQPDASVVFLCFRSKRSFDEHQAKEIAGALERSGNRFLCSLWRPSEKGKMDASHDYADLAEVNRTAEVGRVIGWAP